MALILLSTTNMRESLMSPLQGALEILAVEGDDFSIRDLRILFDVAEHEGSTVLEIMSRTNVTESNVMRSLAALSTPQHQLVVRQPSSAVHHADTVKVTTKGQLILKLLRLAWRKPYEITHSI